MLVKDTGEVTLKMVSEIERRKGLSYEEFAETYLYPLKPVIITDAIRHWKALSRWTPEFFKAEFGNMQLNIKGSEKGQAGYGGQSAVDCTMAEFIDRVLCSTEENPAPYLRNQVLQELFPSLRQDIQPLPNYFTPNWLPDRYLVKQVAETLNRGAAIELYIGGKGGTFPVLHYDGAATHAFLMQVYGRKQFILFSPDQDSFLYPSPDKENLSLVNVSSTLRGLTSSGSLCSLGQLSKLSCLNPESWRSSPVAGGTPRKC